MIFTSRLGADDEGYAEAAQKMVELVRDVPGYLGVESVRDGNRVGITVAYFRDEDAIRVWRDQPDHAWARGRGRARWYDAFEVRVAKVERAYGFERP